MENTKVSNSNFEFYKQNSKPQNISESNSSGWSGARSGSGRKTKYNCPTKVIRVPVNAIPEIEKPLISHKW